MQRRKKVKEDINSECIREAVEMIRYSERKTEKYRALYNQTQERCDAEMARLTAEYEDRISVMQEEIQQFTEQIEQLKSHIVQLNYKNTIMDAQLNIVKMMCGVEGE